MNDCTIISYPGHIDGSLLSLYEDRSRYMLPLGGRYRIIDFTLRNSLASNIKNTIIVSNIKDSLDEYIKSYHKHSGTDSEKIKLFSRKHLELAHIKDLIEETTSQYFIIYNGDNPSIIDFNDIINRFIKKKSAAVLFRHVIGGKPSMAYKILVIRKKNLISIINDSIKKGDTAPNLFEMIINNIIHKGIKKDKTQSLYWPIRGVPEYRDLNLKIIWDPELEELLLKNNVIQSQIRSDSYAHIGPYGRVKGSFIGDSCVINGRVENSILFPGVKVNEDSFIRDSIILPYVTIGRGCKLTNCIVDEFFPSTDPEVRIPLVIGNCCVIGSTEESIKNEKHPGFLYNSITLIGKHNFIPDNTRIGGGCYVASGSAETYFAEKNNLYNGQSTEN